MADYNIEADITANTKGYEAGIKKAQESTKKFSTSVSKVIQGLGKNGLVGALGSIGLASAGLSATLGAVVKIAKQVSQAIGECTDAYKKQLIAERQLETATNNNPLVTGTAKKRLTEFASEMQKVSNYGDEELIPMMANLVSLGRTEEETMKIMAVAMDMSASGSMSLDTAITQLNATLNGNIGRLGQQNAELKGLTEEELKSGRAVDILAEKYKGLASATIDTKKQLQNAIGDLKETFGSVFEKAMAPMRKFFTDLIQGWADARKAKQEYENSIVAIEKGEATANDYRVKEKKLLEEIEAIEGDLRKQAEDLGMTYEEAYNLMADWQRAQLEAMKEELDNTRLLAKMHDGLEKIKQKEAEWAQEEADRRQAEIDKETKIADLKTEYLQKIAEQEAKWKHIKDITGEQISNEEKIAFYQDSLVDLMTKAGGQITTNNQLYKDQMAIIQKLQEGLNPKETSTEWEKKLFQQTIERLEEEKQAMLESKAFTEMSTEEKFRIEKAYNDKLYELNLQRIQQERENALKSVEDSANAEEEKKRIMEYYQNLIKDNAKKYSTSMEKAGEEASKGFAKGFKNVLNEVSNIMQKIGKVIGKMFSGAKGGLGKLFDLNPDTALEGLLKLEDKILTFFMETLPKIPQFIASALQSVSVMMSTIKLNIDKKQIRAMIKNIMTTVKMFVPDILKVGLEIAREIVEGLAEGIKENAGLIGQVLTDMAQILAQYMPPVVLAIIDAVSKFISAIPDSAIMSLVNGAIDLVIKLASALINNAVAIAEKLIPALFEIILQLFKKLPEILKTVLWEVIKGLGKVASFIWEGVKKLFGFETGTNNAPKGLALVGEAGPELVNFKGGERVLNARNTQRALEGATSGNAGNTFNVTFNNLQDTSAYAMMSQLRQYNRQLSINGVI
jgi:hypothetical protein